MKIEGKEYRTIWFENNVVKIIDQTKLPHQFIVKELKTVKDAIKYPYWGVTKNGEMHGWTGRAKINSKAKDLEVAERLWNISCELSGIEYLN